MSFFDMTVAKSAKMSAMDRVLSSISREATKDVVSQQAINAAIAEAIQHWLKVADEAVRVEFFAGIEAAVSEAVARKIERHPLRPDAVTPIVEAVRLRMEEEKLAKKANAARLKEERELQQLAELKAKYEAETKVPAKLMPKADA